MSFAAVFAPILAAALLGGASAGLLGVFVIGLRMPLLAVFAAHSALAGAVFAELAGAPHELGALVGASAGALVLGFVLRRRDLDPNAALGSLFSLSMGLAFLGIGLGEGPRSSLLGLLWGSLLLVDGGQLARMAAAAAALLLFAVLWDGRLRVLLFSRELAATLFREGALFAVLMVLAAAVITVNLDTVGGLMLYSLIANPAVAALRLARTYPGALVLASALGAASAVGGFLTAYWLDLPVGACIVILSSLLLGVVLWVAR